MCVRNRRRAPPQQIRCRRQVHAMWAASDDAIGAGAAHIDSMEPVLYAFDIETTSLTWDTGRVKTVAVCSAEHSWVFEDDDETLVLRELRAHMAALPAGVVVTWNGAFFDGPYLAGRADTLGVEHPCTLFADRSLTPKYDPQPGFPRYGMHPIFDACGTGLHAHADIAFAWRELAETAGVHWGLKPVARSEGLEVIEVDRTRMDALSRDERMAYNLSDVHATLGLARRLDPSELAAATMPPLPVPVS